MRIKIVQSKHGYAVFWKRFRFQPFWYFTDCTCIKAWPVPVCFDIVNYQDTLKVAIAKTVRHLENHTSRDKRRTIATLNSLQELKDYENASK